MNYYITIEGLGKTLTAVEEEGALIYLGSEEPAFPLKEYKETPLLSLVRQQVFEYFHHGRKEFTFPMSPRGTEFQRMVWKALTEIPYGTTQSYSDIAKKIHREKAVRAVGGACNKNPILLAIPCHRVIGKNGALVGFGAGIPLKVALLELEGV